MTELQTMTSIDWIKDRLTPLFRERNVKKAVLFGSYARGDETEFSDVDLLLDTDRKIKGLALLGFFDEIAETLQKPVDAFDVADIDPESQLFQNIQKEGVTIFG